jgi:hypothetical protein
MLRRICWLLLLTFTLGCGAKQPPQTGATENDDVVITEADVQIPATYPEALPRIKGYRDTIRAAIEAGTPGKAHRSLDELDIVLDKLPAIAKASGVPQEQWETVNTAAQELRNLFNQVHAAIDAKREPDFKAVAEPIDASIAKLEKVAS